MKIKIRLAPSKKGGEQIQSVIAMPPNWNPWKDTVTLDTKVFDHLSKEQQESLEKDIGNRLGLFTICLIRTFAHVTMGTRPVDKGAIHIIDDALRETQKKLREIAQI